MATFVTWLRDQEKREGDPVGWFACYWRDLEGKPRLSSPASIAKHLEDRGLFQGQNGLTEAYDATLAEYRKVRAGVVQAAAAAEGVEIPPGMVQDQLPLASAQEAVQTPQRGLAGQAVDRATAAAVKAAQRHEGTPADQIEHMLFVIMRKLERIEAAMGLATDEDDGMLPAHLPWSAWYEQAAVYAVAHPEEAAGW